MAARIRHGYGWLLRVNLIEIGMSFLFVWLGFNFYVLGSRPGQESLEAEIGLPMQYLWNGALLIFGAVSIVAFLWDDLVTRKLLRASSNLGLSLTIATYGAAFFQTFGWARSSLTLSTFGFFFLMTAGTAAQTLMSLRPRRPLDDLLDKLDLTEDELRRAAGLPPTPDSKHPAMDHDGGVKDDGNGTGGPV